MFHEDEYFLELLESLHREIDAQEEVDLRQQLQRELEALNEVHHRAH